MSLNLTTYESLPPIALTPPEQRRSPELALILSCLFPGLGQLYVGLSRQAAWLGGTEVLALMFVFFGSGPFHGQAIIVVPSLYLFGILDAYFSAREWNAGASDLMIGSNPRITAILNLLTKGFGYFYLGDRTKGIICFFVVSAVQGILLAHTNAWTSILAITIQVGIAIDGFVVARRRLYLDHPELLPTTDPVIGTAAPSPLDQANPGGLTPRLAMGIFMTLGIAITVGYATLTALSGHAVHSNGTLEQSSTGLTYRNIHEGVELTVPEDWGPSQDEGSLVFLRADGVSLIVEEKYAIYAVSSMLEETEKEIRSSHSDASFEPVWTRLSGRPASGIEAAFLNKNGDVIRQRILGVRRGLKIFMLVETWIHPERSRDILDRVEQTVHLQ
jgi:hypothetical protein